MYEFLHHVSSLSERKSLQGACLKYDVETFLTDIFTVNGVSESTVYLTSNFGITVALIHIYNWSSSIEDMERIENLGRYCIVTIPVHSYAIILTIGAIDARGRISEQVIRIQKRSE